MKITLVRGVPGSGKSTKAKELIDKAAISIIICEADNFFMVGGEYKFNYKFLGDAHKWCQAMTAYYLMRGWDVIVSNTSVYMKDITRYYNLAKKYGAEFEIINCTGNWQNIHNVPEDVIKRMKENFKVITTEEFINSIEENN